MSLRGVLLRQKDEWSRLRKKTLVKRDAFDFAAKQLKSELIKVIVGPRRAGKSALAAMLLKDARAAYVNFDEIELVGVGFDQILTELYTVYPDCPFVFFDEIQNLDQWPLALNRLQRDGKNIVVTGSNARLLSSELMTHLTGRHVAIEILPFSFTEYLRAKNIDVASVLPTPERLAEITRFFDTFAARGGYPETVVNIELDQGPYLASLWNSIIYTDVVARKNVRRPQAVADLGGWILSNTGKQTSYRKMGLAVGIESPITAEKYVRWLEEAYLLTHVTRYSHKAFVRLRSPKKYYAIDVGLIDAVAVKTSPDNGRLLENAVMNELQKAHYQPGRRLFYYKSDDGRHEVDFVVKGDDLHVTELIQVCWDISDERTRRRELSALISASSELDVQGPIKLTLITRGTKQGLVEDGKTVTLIPFWEWAALLH